MSFLVSLLIIFLVNYAALCLYGHRHKTQAINNFGTDLSLKKIKKSDKKFEKGAE